MEEVARIAKSCLNDRHVEVIEKQKEAIVELRSHVGCMEELTVGTTLPQVAHQHILKIKKQNEQLKQQLRDVIATEKINPKNLTEDENRVKISSLQKDLTATRERLEQTSASLETYEKGKFLT